MNTEYNLDLVIQAKNEASAQLQKVSNDVKKMKENVDNTKDSVSWLTSKQRQLNLKANTENLKRELQDIRTEILNLESSSASPENLARLDQLQQEYANVKQQIVANTQALWDLWWATKNSTSLLWWLWTKLLAVATAWKLAYDSIRFLINTFNDFQQSQKIIIQETWATWEQLRKLSDSMLEVQWTVAQSQWQIAQAIGEVNTRLWLEWDELEKTTTQFLKFANITWQDWKQAIADNVRLFNSWWVATSEQSKYLDQLASAWQKTWVNVWQLTTNLQQNSATLQQMWFSLTDSIALLSQFEQMWVETNSTLQAMKIWITNLVKDWIAPTEARDTIIANIQNAKDDTEALNLACEYFWNRWWVQMFKAIRSWTVDIKTMSSELENAIWTVEKTNEAMETLWEFLSRKRNWIVADFIQWNNEGFRATQELAWIISDELSPSIEKAESYIDSWKKAIVWTIQWEVERTYENWVLTASLNEQWVASEQARVKAEQLKQAEENAIAITNQYAQSWELLNKALATFDALKIDDSTTRSEFEQSKNSALALAQSFQVALASKLALAKTDYKEAIQSKDIHQVAQAYQNLNYLMNEQVALQWKIAEIQNSTWSWKTTWGWGSWSWKSNADKEAEAYAKAREKEFVAMQKAHKEYLKQKEEDERKFYKQVDEEAKYMLKRQENVLSDLNKEYKEKFDEISKKVKDTQKNVDDLVDAVASLRTKLSDLKVDERKSIAQEVVNARKELKALEEQYVWLKDVANSVSREDLQWVWWIWKYDVDLIKKYKDYQDELASMYNWMSSSEQEALNKEIEYAEWYDSLNWIEKIKEDYRIRQEEIQNELNSKLASLEAEQNTLRAYKKEQQRLQDERIKRIDEEYKKYQKMYDDVKKFEDTYMQKLETDHLRQMKMCDDLADARHRVYLERLKAERGWEDWSRASGWPVYAWNSYLVWETWPELFVPSTNWNIVKNSDLDNISSPINISIEMWWVVLNNWLDEEELLDRMETRLTRTLQLYKKWIYS